MQPCDLITDQEIRCANFNGCWLTEWHGTGRLTSLCLVHQITFSIWLKLIQLCEHY